MTGEALSDYRPLFRPRAETWPAKEGGTGRHR